MPASRSVSAMSLALLCLAGLAATGCGSLRLHRPQELATAQEAQARFEASDLGQTVAAERERLNAVLAEELELIRKHTLARRDGRLLYIIGQGDSKRAWNFLKSDIQSRICELGFDPADAWIEPERSSLEPARPCKPPADHSFRGAVMDQAEAERRLGFHQTASTNWDVEKAGYPALPTLSCPDDRAEADLQKKIDAAIPADKEIDREDATGAFEDFRKTCDAYLKASTFPLVNQGAIDKLKQAKAETEAANEARLAVVSAQVAQLAAAAEEEKKGAQDKLVTTFGHLGSLGAHLGTAAEKTAKTKREEASEALAGLGLSHVVDNLGATAKKAQLELERGNVMAAISETLGNEDFQKWLSPHLQGANATQVIGTLKDIGTTVQAAKAAPGPVTALLMRQELLDLDIAEAAKREAFFDGALELLVEQNDAYRVEILELGQAVRILNDADAAGCLTPPAPQRKTTKEMKAIKSPPGGLMVYNTDEHELYYYSDAMSDWVSQSEAGKLAEPAERWGLALLFNSDPRKKCQDKIFRLLVHYATSWTLGRVEQEQIDQRLIGLHQQAALDSSEIAFAKWQSLLGRPIGQLVAYHKTGVRAESIVEFLQLLGLGSIAAGVN